MNKQKPSRRSRLIRKWDGTPVAEIEPPAESASINAEPTTQAPADRAPRRTDLVFEFEREEELTDNMDR